MNHAEVLKKLRGLGYDGPKSRTKTQLLELLAQFTSTGPAGLAGTDTRVDPVMPVGDEPGRARPTTGRRGRLPARPRPDPFVRATEWEGLRPGLEFRVRGEPGAWFAFVAHVTNPVTGESWVDGVGGTKHHVSCRAFRPDRLVRRNDVIVTRRSRMIEEEAS